MKKKIYLNPKVRDKVSLTFKEIAREAGVDYLTLWKVRKYGLQLEGNTALQLWKWADAKGLRYTDIFSDDYIK